MNDPAETHAVSVPSLYDGLPLSTYIHEPTNGSDIKYFLVLAHPYPPLGGSTDNNVIQSLWHRLSLTFPCLHIVAYNARGTPQTGGRTSWTCQPECVDAVSVCLHVLQRYHPSPENEIRDDRSESVKIILCGYSYGAVTLCTAASDHRIRPHLAAVIAVSYPLGVLGWLTLWQGRDALLRQAFGPSGTDSDHDAVPTLVVTGTRDQFTSSQRIERDAGDRFAGVSVVTIPECDHFWFGRENQLCDIVVRFLRPLLTLN